MQKSKSLSPIRSGEWKLFLLFSFVTFANMFSLEATFLLSTSGFISQLGGRQLPWLWTVDMAIVMAGTAIYSLMIDRWPRRKFIQGLLIILIVIYIAARLFLSLGIDSGIIYTILYLVAEQQLLLLPIALWALANDVFTVAQAKRLFPLIAASSIVGGILGNVLAASSAILLEKYNIQTSEILLANALIILLAFTVFLSAEHLFPATQNRDNRTISFHKSLSEGWDFVKNVDSFRFLALAMLAIGFALTFIEFKFLTTTSAAYPGTAFQTFYGVFRIVQTILVIILQGIFASKIIERIGLKHVFLLLPAICGVFILSMLLGGGLVGIMLTRLMGRVTLFGLDEPARKSLQGLIPGEKRGRVSAFLDGYLYPLGTIIASLILLILIGVEKAGWIQGLYMNWVYWGVGLLISSLAFWAAFRLRQTYDKSLLNYRLARRKRREYSVSLDF